MLVLARQRRVYDATYIYKSRLQAIVYFPISAAEGSKIAGEMRFKLSIFEEMKPQESLQIRGRTGYTRVGCSGLFEKKCI